MGLLSAWRTSRFRRRWMTEEAVISDSVAVGRAPNATLDEVGGPGQDVHILWQSHRTGQDATRNAAIACLALAVLDLVAPEVLPAQIGR